MKLDKPRRGYEIPVLVIEFASLTEYSSIYYPWLLEVTDVT